MTNAEKLRKVNDYLAETLTDPEWRDMIEEYKTILMTRESAENEKHEPITREYILKEAARIVCYGRNTQYGEPEDSFRVIAALWTIYVAEKCAPENAYVCIAPEDAAMMMALLKIARTASGVIHKADTYIDIAGYAACAAETAANTYEME